MREIATFGCWTLCYVDRPDVRRTYSEVPVFRLGAGILDSRSYTPFQVACSADGISVYAELKKWIDASNPSLRFGADSRPEWRAANQARLAMHYQLVRIGAFREELLKSQVGA